MAKRRLKADQYQDQDQSGNIFSFPRAGSGADEADGALDLVHQAADFFREMQQRAQDTEMRAQTLCRAASEKVRLAEMRAEAAEQAYRDLMNAVDQKLQEASRAIAQAQASMSAQVERRTAAEFRMQSAEAETRASRQALQRVEEAIRQRLLNASDPRGGRFAAVA
jgi:transketolase